MKTITRLLFSIVLIAFCSLSANAQRGIGAQSLVLDDGSGHTSTLVAPAGGGGTITLPSISGTLSVGGFTPSFFNAYTTAPFIAIGAGTEVPILALGALAVNAGFANDDFGAFTATATGVYNVEFTVAPEESSAFAIAVNGIIVPYSEFGCATGTTVVHGNAILSLTAGSVITLVNASSVSVILTAVYSGAVTASLSATRIQ